MFAKRMEKTQKSFIREILKVIKQDGVISFAGGLPNPNFFPIKGIKEACINVLENSGEEVLQYTITEGYPELRKYIAKGYEEKEVEVSWENILMLNGSQQGLDLLGKIFLDRGDEIIMERPGYLGALQSFSLYEPNINMITLNDDGVDLQELEDLLKKKKVKFFYSVPNFQNPTGISYTNEKREELAKLLDKYQVVFVEDDPYGAIRFLGEEQKSMAYYYPQGTILLGSFSKTVAPGLRTGWICAKDEVFEKLVIAKQGSDLHSNHLSQRLIYDYLINNDIQTHLKLIQGQYGRQRATMVEEAKNIFPGDFSITLPEGGMFLWVAVPSGFDVGRYFDYAIKEGVAFVPGNPFYLQGDKVEGFRLNFSNSHEGEIKEGMSRMKVALDKYKANMT